MKPRRRCSDALLAQYADALCPPDLARANLTPADLEAWVAMSPNMSQSTRDFWLNRAAGTTGETGMNPQSYMWLAIALIGFGLLVHLAVGHPR